MPPCKDKFRKPIGILRQKSVKSPSKEYFIRKNREENTEENSKEFVMLRFGK